MGTFALSSLRRQENSHREETFPLQIQWKRTKKEERRDIVDEERIANVILAPNVHKMSVLLNILLEKNPHVTRIQIPVKMDLIVPRRTVNFCIQKIKIPKLQNHSQR